MLDKLRTIQRDQKLNDGEMAARLGISRSGWNLIRRGKMPLSDSVAVTAAGVWPSLTRDLLDRAESAAGSLTDSAQSNASPNEAA